MIGTFEMASVLSLAFIVAYFSVGVLTLVCDDGLFISVYAFYGVCFADSVRRQFACLRLGE